MGPTQQLAPEAFLAAVVAAFEASSDAISLTDAGGTVRYANAAAARLLGREGELLSGYAVWELQPGLDLARWQANWQLLEQKGSFRAENLSPPVNGRRRAIEASSMLVGQGDRRLCFTQMRDVTEARDATDDRRLLGVLVEAMPEAVVAVGLDGLITSWSPGAEALYGWTPAEVLGKPARAVLGAGVTPAEADRLCSQLREEKVVVRTDVHPCKSGRTVSCRVSVTLLLNAARQPTGCLVVARDETTRLAAEAALARSQRQLADAIAASGLARWEWKRETGVLVVEQEFRELDLAWPLPGERMTAFLQRFIHPDDLEAVQAHADFHFLGQSPRIDLDCRAATAAGGWRWVRALGQVASRGPGDEPLEVSGFVLDVQARKDAHERELEVSRLAADVRTLRGLLPICAWCHKVRDDHGYWDQLDQYVAAHTGTRFSHAICPDCEKKQFQGHGP